MNQKYDKPFSQIPRWKYLLSLSWNKWIFYGRFVLSPLKKGQADIIGIAMRRALLGELERTCITHAKLETIYEEFNTLPGVKESISEILSNLSVIGLRSSERGTWEAFICVRGARDVTAQDIILPNSVAIIDNTQHIATLTEPFDFCVRLTIQRNCLDYRQFPFLSDEKGYSTNPPLWKPGVSIKFMKHCYENASQEILFLEIWTDVSLTSKEALRQTCQRVIPQSVPFLDGEEEENFDLSHNQTKSQEDEQSIYFYLGTQFPMHISAKLESIPIEKLVGLPAQVYRKLKKAGIHTLLDLLHKRYLKRITNFSTKDLKKVMDNIPELRRKGLL